jgi:hypothetical protein
LVSRSASAAGYKIKSPEAALAISSIDSLRLKMLKPSVVTAQNDNIVTTERSVTSMAKLLTVKAFRIIWMDSFKINSFEGYSILAGICRNREIN